MICGEDGGNRDKKISEPLLRGKKNLEWLPPPSYPGKKNLERPSPGKKAFLREKNWKGLFEEKKFKKAFARRKWKYIKKIKLRSLDYVTSVDLWSPPPGRSLMVDPLLQFLFQVLEDLADLGDMERYLKSPRKGSVLRVFHLVSSAEQVAQALSYLVSSFCSNPFCPN